MHNSPQITITDYYIAPKKQPPVASLCKVQCIPPLHMPTPPQPPCNSVSACLLSPRFWLLLIMIKGILFWNNERHC